MTFYSKTTYRVTFHVIICLLLFTIGCDDSGITDSNPGTGQEGTEEVVISVASPEGEEVADMRFNLLGEQDDYETRTDENGEFSLEVVPGEYRIEGNAIQDSRYLSIIPRQTQVSVAEGETVSAELDTKEGYYLALENVTVNGESGNTSVPAGSTIDVSFDYTAWSRSENPGSIVYVAVGTEDSGQEAVSIGVPGSYPGEEGSASASFTAPEEEGTYNLFALNAADISRSDALSRYEDEFPDSDKFIPLPEIEVTESDKCFGPSFRANPGDGHEYFISENRFSVDQDIPTLIEDEFGEGAELAEWNDLKAAFESQTELEDFLDAIGMVKDEENCLGGSGFLTRGGERFYSGDRNYLMTRHDGDVSDSYLVHDDLYDNTLSLGSWYNDRHAIVRIPE